MQPSDPRYETVMRVVRLASRRWERLHGREQGEYLGLCWEIASKKVEQFDPGRGVKLETYLNNAISFGVRTENATEYARQKHAVPLDAVAEPQGPGDLPKMELTEEVQALLGRLDDFSRAVVTLVYLEGRTRREVARIMHMSEAVICATVRRSIKRMRGGN